MYHYTKWIQNYFCSVETNLDTALSNPKLGAHPIHLAFDDFVTAEMPHGPPFTFQCYHIFSKINFYVFEEAEVSQGNNVHLRSANLGFIFFSLSHQAITVKLFENSCKLIVSKFQMDSRKFVYMTGM